MLSRTILKLLQIIVQILDEKWSLYILSPFAGLGAMNTVHLRLIGKHVVN